MGGAYPIWLSWKLDGLTLVLTYDNGNLVKILTRGNGNLGTNITFLKGAIGGFPQRFRIRGIWLCEEKLPYPIPILHRSTT